jgi:long-chain acyl-CoA synthetase
MQMQGPQARFWPKDGLGGQLRVETHYDGRELLCFSERPTTLNAAFDAALQRFPDRQAIVEDDEAITYRELDRRVALLASNLAAAGLARGDRVALFLGNCWEFLVILLSCSRLGIICVPIGTRQKAEELDFLINNSGAKALFFEAELSTHVPKLERVASLAHVVFVRGEAPFGRPFTDFLVEGLPAAPLPALAEEDVAVILYTSGTTGQPKGAELTHFGIIHSCLHFGRCLDLTHEDRGIVAVPLSHVTGLVAVALAMLTVGGTTVLMRQSYKTPDFLALMARERVSFCVLVPAIYTLSVMHPDLGTYDLSAWRVGGFGGAPMPVATIELLVQKLPNLTLINAYGATETTSPTTIMPPAEGMAHQDSVGQVVPCGEVKVMDETGQPVAPGVHGELWIKGPMVVPGYWQRPDANRSEFVDGFWRSGDIGSMDVDGFVRVFDRRKDMINRGGFKIFSAEVENVLSHHEGVLECAIVGRADPVLGERVHAFVVPREGAVVTEEMVRAFCAERIADYKVPETVTIRAELLPRNANGKLQKQVLREIVKELPSLRPG